MLGAGQYSCTADTVRGRADRRRGDSHPHPKNASISAASALRRFAPAAADTGAMDDGRLVDTAVTFLFAGHETSALGLTHTRYSLADRPAFQRRVRREVAALDGDPGPADLRECPALTAAVDEAIRLYPPVHSFFREPTEPVTFGATASRRASW